MSGGSGSLGFGARPDGKAEPPAPPPSHFFKVLAVGVVFAVLLPYITHALFPGDVRQLNNLLAIRSEFGGKTSPGIRRVGGLATARFGFSPLSGQVVLPAPLLKSCASANQKPAPRSLPAGNTGAPRRPAASMAPWTGGWGWTAGGTGT